MKKSEVPDGFRAPVFNGCQTHSVCMQVRKCPKEAENSRESEREVGITLRGGFSIFSRGKVAVKMNQMCYI